MNFKIEKGIPAPCTPENLRTGRKLLYPFAEMKVGDSFLVPETEDIRNRADRVKSAASTYSRKHSIRLATKIVEGGVRVWRLA
ncbi:hypothetical protein [Paraburkholderia terrae]|uniref:DUF7303 family protein n=1 Tax=Paraburkholderia terrae TaxID=311230 RepID=UPI001EE35806|nr:hypothetical protein [Paraburkholderia terrae]GJH00244.1 hypothetical protein CBA19C8_06825 [Paraburkholderia terrae]